MNRTLMRAASSAVVAAVILSSCATTPGSDQSAAASDTAPGCNPLVGAGIGAVVGAIANKGKGAAVGAAVGALGCMAINAMSKQTKPASQVESDFRKNNQGSLPAEPVVSSYQVVVQPGSTVTAGQPVTITSTSEVVSGTATPVTEIREEFALLDPSGKEQAKKSKVLTEKGAGSGGYENQFNFRLPQGVPQGAYTIRTTLYVNGAAAGTNDAKVQLVLNTIDRSETRMAAIR
ncbi:MAG: hypothetical protein R3F27_09045 [Gammaproteobacteria bacterium]